MQMALSGNQISRIGGINPYRAYLGFVAKSKLVIALASLARSVVSRETPMLLVSKETATALVTKETDATLITRLK